MTKIDEYLELERNNQGVRYEYIDGHITMLAGGTLNHATISGNMFSILHSALRGRSCRAYTSDARVRLSETRYVYPDVTVTCDARDRGSIDFIQYPRLVVEVLSPSTCDYDRGSKFTFYRECPTIQEYMLIATDHPAVELFRREKNTLWTLFLFALEDSVQVSSLDLSFTVAELYEGIIFAGSDDKQL
ncbi:Uma2 family endonuclease [Ktedonosporobacter rubrisoli]|uniref:Uma2 family endonuclease n=2 Tax=Ktedonosporobacter rubrisoli TaxID=2509675 RepID=A0A4P6K5J0_KTERU|nr:Uma2 family endonuclease [Ktedonosporobacter rubrisoli]